jgi:hypothetical protein
MYNFLPKGEQDRTGQVCEHYRKICVVSVWWMCLVGEGRLLDVSSAVPAAAFSENKSGNFRESYVALALNVVWEMCGLAGHCLICSPTILQL